MNSLTKFRNTVAKHATAVHTACALALLGAMTSPAGAVGTELSDAFTASVDKAQLLVIGGIVLGIAGVIFLIRSSRKSSGG